MRYIGATNGKISIFEKEKPEVLPSYVLVETDFSAISPGTELTMSSNSKDQVVSLGYSAAGTVIEVGEGADFKVGDKVAVYGAPYTGHREYLCVPKTLAVKVPDHVDLREASMAGLGAIAIHALRQADLKFGEVAVVVGLGIYGQLISQIAHQAGIVVLPLNRSSQRAELLEEISGIKSYSDEKEMEAKLNEITGGKGADAVFLCVGGDSTYLTNKSLEWIRNRGKSVIVGDIQPNYERELMFGKEAEIIISRAGGPGRYDPVYEREAVDYPYGYVRWTEGRNTGEYVRLISEERIKVKGYFGEDFSLDEFEEAYASLDVKGAPHLTQIFNYKKGQK